MNSTREDGEEPVHPPASLLGAERERDRGLELGLAGVGFVDADLELPPPPGIADQRRHRRRERRERARQVGLALRLHHGGLAEVADLPHQACQRPHRCVRGRVVAVGSALPEPAQRDDVAGGGKAARRAACPVAPSSQPAPWRASIRTSSGAGDRAEPFGVLRPRNHALLVRVQPGEERALPAVRRPRPQRGGQIVRSGSPPRRLDLGDVAAEVGEQLAAIGDGRCPSPIPSSGFRPGRSCRSRLCSSRSIVAVSARRRQASEKRRRPGRPCMKT